MSNDTDIAADADALKASRDADLTALWARMDNGDDDAYTEFCDYSLSLEYDAEGDYVRLIFSTGGPHDEIRWHQRPYGTACDVTYVYLPWFGRFEDGNVTEALQRTADYYAEVLGPEFFEER